MAAALDERKKQLTDALAMLRRGPMEEPARARLEAMTLRNLLEVEQERAMACIAEIEDLLRWCAFPVVVRACAEMVIADTKQMLEGARRHAAEGDLDVAVRLAECAPAHASRTVSALVASLADRGRAGRAVQ